MKYLEKFLLLGTIFMSGMVIGHGHPLIMWAFFICYLIVSWRTAFSRKALK